ncbi:MAG: type II CRISPR-associated endonuclease Cas1 [Hornefia sp.]|nr:type II CRISPR-associated endonuclease Cas1 [Hornefia sp.]
MSWRTVVIKGIAKLDYRLGFLTVRKEDGTTSIHIGEIGLLLIESTTVSLTTTLISELMKKKVKVIFCDEKHNPESELISYYGSHDTSMKIKQQIGWGEFIKEEVWTEIVTEKIRKQMWLLYELGHTDSGDLLKSYISEIKQGDATNREGHAAKVYFNSLFGLDFTRSDDSVTNAALNYGYGIILSCFTREIVSNGYLTQIGLFHDNMFNPFNLASDFMEPFRILVDSFVENSRFEEFEHEEKLSIVNLLSEEILIDGKMHTVSNGIKIYCRSLFDALNERDLSYIKFYKYEL